MIKSLLKNTNRMTRCMIAATLSFVFFTFGGTVAAHAACTSDQIDVLGDGTQCETTKFSLTTTNTTDSFSFSLSAIGTFYVDCSAGGTLSGTGASGNIITRSDTTDTTYTCTYETADAYTIKFAGGATNTTTSYNTSAAAISFYQSSNNSAAKIASVSGNLSSMFPYISGNAANGAQPRFRNTFNGATNLKSIPNTLFADYTSASASMFWYTFQNCSGLTSIPQNLFFPNATSVTGADYMFYRTFGGCSGLTSLPADLFSKITSAAEYMFSNTFYGCSGLTSLPQNLFFPNATSVTGANRMFEGTFQNCSGLTSLPQNLFFPNATSVTGADHMFYNTFSSCRGLTLLPADLFSKITTSAQWMFGTTFYGCSNLGGYIPPTTFKGLIDAGHPTADYMFYYTFNNTKLVTSCPTGTTQFITGYEGSSTSASQFGGKVSCEQSSGLAVTLDNTGTDTPSSPTTVYLKYMDGWYSDSNVTNAITGITLPTKSGYIFSGYYTEQNGNGARVINGLGNFITNNPQLTSTTLYPYFVVSTAIETAKFTLTTTNTTNSFSFSLSAIGTFYVDWGDGDIEAIVRDNTTDTTYTHNYSTAGAYTIKFVGGATNTTTSYNTNTSTAAISFYNSAAKIASVSGNLSSVFPYISENAADGAQPRFYNTFNGAKNLKSIPNTLFADYTSASTNMFSYTFSYCTGLTSLPADLFSKITTSAAGMFANTFNNCSGLTSLPQNLFFPNATSVTGAESMFSGTFRDCSGLTSLPADLFSKITSAADYMFVYTFQGCSNLGGYIPPTMFKGLIDAGHPMAEMMFYNTFFRTELMTSCPTGTTQFITGYEGESDWEDFGGKVSCEPSILSITLDTTGATTAASPSTVYLAYDTGWYSDSTGETTITVLTTVPTKTGYVFNGFWTGANGTGTQVIDGNGIFLTSPNALRFATGATTVYAKWVCAPCDATNASCSVSVVNDVCTYTTSCNSGYGNIQNNGAYNASCSPNVYDITLNNITRLPSGYTQLEYIESTGTQYIDTGIQGTSNIGVSIDFQYTNSETNEQILFGVVGPNFAFWRTGTTHFSYAYKNDYGATGYVGIPDTNEHTLDVNFYNNGLMRFDNVSEQLPSDSFSHQGTMYLFSSNYPNAGTINNAYHNSAAKIFNFKLTNGTTLVRNMIPAKRDSDGVLGMYDLVSNTFFTNAGTGTFVAGPALESYTYGVGKTLDYLPTRDGYVFTGWCTDSGLTNCAMTQTIGTDATGDKEFWANWSACNACSASNATCTMSVVNNTCTYITACSAGYYGLTNNGAYNPSCSACGGNGYYCTNGEQHTVDVGYYSTGGTETTHTGQSQCTGTTYCANGVQANCPTGYTYDTTTGKSAASQCKLQCATGNYIGTGDYTKLEYLESTGTQYINTGITPTDGTGLKVKFNRSVESDQVVTGLVGEGGNNYASEIMVNAAIGFYLAFAEDYHTAQFGSTSNNVDYEVSINYMNDRKRYINGVSKTDITKTLKPSDSEIPMFAGYNLNSHAYSWFFKGKIYYAKFTSGTTLIRDFIPVRRNSDNVLGMLDLVTGTFFTNAGTGTFVAGPDVGVIAGTCTNAGDGYWSNAAVVDYGSTAPRTQCTVGYYCANGTQNECPSEYGTSAAGASANTECYRSCAIANNGTTFTNITHATAVSGNDYYNTTATDTCEATSCENGWHVKAGNPDLRNLIGEQLGTVYVAINNNGEDKNNNASTYGLTSNDKNVFIVDYGNSGMLRGSALCSTRAGAENTWENSFATYNVIAENYVSTLANETGEEGAMQCYCRLDSYTPSGGQTQSLDSLWLFRLSKTDAAACASQCADHCGHILRNVESNRLAFRGAMFDAVGSLFATCDANAFNITWIGTEATDISVNNAGTATYGGDIRTPFQPIDKTNIGYMFKGWKFRKASN